MKREVDDVDGTNLYNVLYTGKDGEVFFFYDEKNAKKPEKNGLHLCVLDTESNMREKGTHELKRQFTKFGTDPLSVSHNCSREETIAKDSIVDKYIRDYNTKRYLK